MGRFNSLILAVTLFFALITETEGQWQPPDVAPRPLCASQIALANYACAMLPYSTVLPPPTPSLSLSDNHESQSTPSPSHTHRHEHQHRHWHEHQHRHRHEQEHGHQHKIPLSPLEENCCKWVQQLDSECICGLLSRLPAFLERPQHNFSVTVGSSCDATYSCRGGIKS
ncbi:unnamed protein product [Citrullus colocynthis]|uniref:Bifunctional inhibitor/plant lipid transfer protein/seed storage helical domain-containing protein n=1 Tax=Citrullus colocynthis TaxID=252529 RepID=A0ABP0XPB7_9ROSI